MKHGNGIRFAKSGPALRRAGRVRLYAPGMNARRAVVARVAAVLSVAARRHLLPWLAMPFAAASIAIASAGRFAGSHAPAAATLARAIASGRAARSAARSLAKRRPAPARASPSMPSPARRRSLSSVRLTLMQDHSS
ncbi:hypothetical protein [Burkholderia stabilis]|uniref:hypothetical protein n=1 Tax=Burkholderia stabilis TaxID=95485 RepID=UPI001F4A26B2|nr:hypothetical protein [Burkholderia stabilis]